MLIQLQKTAFSSIDLHNGVSGTLIYTDEGVPVLAAVEMAGKVVVLTCDDPKFESCLQSFGFDKRMLPEVKKLKL